MTLNGHTRFAGVMGYPISHTASPAMHNAGYQHIRLNAVYIPLLVKAQQLGAAVHGMRASHALGFNVTVPHKENVMAYLDEYDDEAKAIGAVNTVVNREGRLVGYNTDGRGFLLALKEEKNRDVAGKKIVVLGAGGAARGIIYACLEAGAAEVVILNRHPEKAAGLRVHFQAHFETPIRSGGLAQDDFSHQALCAADMVIQTTSAGMSPRADKCPVSWFDWAHPDCLCCDIIYKPAETLFLKQAAENGCETWSGAGMLAGQGVLGFELMTGHPVPYKIMRDILA
jgi:shikimate dehydrogenase